jgi:hypothetical protein
MRKAAPTEDRTTPRRSGVRRDDGAELCILTFGRNHVQMTGPGRTVSPRCAKGHSRESATHVGVGGGKRAAVVIKVRLTV